MGRPYKREERIVTPSGTQATKLINESGLYSLIFSSKLESAKAFKHWVTSEVLPSIRETGTYGVDKEYQKWLSMRQQTITTRKEETSAIKLFIEYTRSQGFTGKDVAEALGYSNPRDAIKKHVDEEDKKSVAIRDGIKGNPNMTLINESGLYSLIFTDKN